MQSDVLYKRNDHMTVYLDNAATTKPCEAAVQAVINNITLDYGNPSSLHKLGIKAEETIREARKAVAAGLVCDPDCLYFTSGATESNNTALFGAADKYGKRRKKLVISAVEHSSVAASAKRLEDMGFEVVRVYPDIRGEISAEDIIVAADDNTFLVSCMLVNNETGTIHPVKRAFSAIKRLYPECVTHCDAVQGFMKIPIKAADLHADMITVSGHKIHAVKGVGALYVKKGIHISSLIYGGGQEKGFRPGTESVPLIAAFGAAADYMRPEIKTNYANAEELNGYLRKKLERLPYVTINSRADECSPYILNFSAEGIRSETMLHWLESNDVYISSGSACSKGAKSPVIAAMKLKDSLADSALRVSLCHTTTYGDIDALVKYLELGYEKLAKVKK